MSGFDILVRGGGIGVLLMLAVVTWRGGARHRLMALTCACGAAYLTVAGPVITQALGMWRWPVVALAASGPFWFLIASRRAFGEPAVLNLRALIALAFCVAGLALAPNWLQGTQRFVVSLTSDLLIVGLFLGALVSIAMGLRDDLDPLRRSRRLTMLAVSAGASALIAAAAFWQNATSGVHTRPSTIDTVVAVIVFLIACGYAVATTALTDDSTRPEPRKPVGDPGLIVRIRAAFELERMHRRAELTLGELARALGVGEHQVRRAINAELGFKNFSAFVNSHRIAEVKQALADPAQAQVPISTIALDAGFGSIASFKRAFKAETGVSPTEFRVAAR